MMRNSNLNSVSTENQHEILNKFGKCLFVESKMLYAKELQNLLNGLLAIDSRYGSNGRIFITLVKVLDNVIGGLNENCINRQ